MEDQSMQGMAGVTPEVLALDKEVSESYASQPRQRVRFWVRTRSGKELKVEGNVTQSGIVEFLRNIRATGFTDLESEGMTIYPWHAIDAVRIEIVTTTEDD